MTKSTSLKATLTTAFSTASDFGVKNPDRKSNVGTALFEIFIWQELCTLAENKLDAAWEALSEEGLLLDDNKLRAKGPGEYIETESDSFSCIVTVKNPGARINKDKFLEAAARKARISKESLEELWENCCAPTKSPLSKKVLEA